MQFPVKHNFSGCVQLSILLFSHENLNFWSDSWRLNMNPSPLEAHSNLLCLFVVFQRSSFVCRHIPQKQLISLWFWTLGFTQKGSIIITLIRDPSLDTQKQLITFFLIFCMKSGNHMCTKVILPDFWRNILILMKKYVRGESQFWGFLEIFCSVLRNCS